MTIRPRPLLLCALLVAAGCQNKSGEHHHDSADGHSHETENSPNKALYDEVMAIHDEVMPKMNALYKAKSDLKARLETPGLNESDKKDLNEKIARIDSASEGMMVWMRQFDPVPDSEGEDKARAYLEGELVKVRKVREDILQALDSAP